jgi:hypothetical protein
MTWLFLNGVCFTLDITQGLSVIPSNAVTVIPQAQFDNCNLCLAYQLGNSPPGTIGYP